MSKREKIRQELSSLSQEGTKLAATFQNKKAKYFQYEYQRWYSKALKAIASLAPDRLSEFKGYYEIDPKRKTLGYGTYVIQDYLKGVAPSHIHYPEFDTRDQALRGFMNQITILMSVVDRIDSIISDIAGELYGEFQDNEIEVARSLAKVNLRAAGALVGVVIEGHLQKVIADRNVTFNKKNPSISELNNALKAANVIDTPIWRKISYLADLRNICSHKKDAEPTKAQVDEMIDGAQWLAKNVF